MLVKVVLIERLNFQEVWTSLKNEVVYCKVVSTNTFSDCLDMKGKFDAYVCTVTFLQKVDFLIINTHQYSQLYSMYSKK
jgi:hypothetical protein